MAAKHDLRDEVIKVHAAFESASKQLAQHPTDGLFFINDHVKTSTPGVLQKLHILQQQQQVCKLSQDQAEDAEATIRDLTRLGAAFCSSMNAQLDQAILACSCLPAPAINKGSSSSPRDYVTKLPQLLSISRLNLTKRGT
ncbi:TPA: hypothetical protein ACH3X2_004168 [Trebouxia sp. C0005]